MKRRTFNKSVVALSAAGWSGSARAQASSFPALVSLVVPFAAGGGADQLAREFANAAQPLLPGTTLVVDNKPGANGAIANRYVARQKPDGSTLLLGTSSTHALGPLLNHTDVDPVADFSPATLLAETSTAWAVLSSSPWHSLGDAIAWARKSPMTYGTFGVGSSAHLYGLVLANATGAKLEHVPYKGSSQAITDLLAGNVDSVLLTTSALDAMTRAGKIRLLAVSGEQRSRLLPDVPTFKEQGVPLLEFNGWFGVFGPKGVPTPLLDRLAAIAKTLGENGEFTTRLVAQGYDWVGSTPSAFNQELARTMEIYRKIIATTPPGELTR
ncbi:Tripartite-type tricarboxylate transporter, receptor component TctC [Enhydrobacter aerosaccus]|uniref:Tripartite-type tricarboxylate transporter, receptor component TctC n=1 Tax=Enhydrobacter aerosaccus TaxID=225324 RepID=A0A1T4TN02_9HYPH|nr:tripartite tricarboxylate transporter substrate binding protein [Enhydrobacter aerosaccus]SKA41802.1 Tripartite-type tricarboxylate transporter, receptor component TctC [Enhydrobacter aerosaccus]